MATKKKAIKKVSKTSGKKKAKLSPIAKRARTLGLESMGYGRWGKMGRVTHRTSGGKLVEVKDSKHNRKMTKDGKHKANDAHVKLAGAIMKKIMLTKKAIVQARKAGDTARVTKLENILVKLREDKRKNAERHAKMAKRFNQVGQKAAA